MSPEKNVVYPKQLQINTGYYNMGSVDELYSYHLYSGGNFCFGLKYAYGERPAREHLALRFAMIDRRPGNLPLNENLYPETDRVRVLNSILFEAVYSFHYPIILFPDKVFNFWVTGDWITTVNISTNVYSLPELIMSGVAPGALLKATLKRHHLSGRFSVPLISWTVRNNYSQSMTQNYETLNQFAFILQNDQLQFPNTLLAINTHLEYGFDLSERINLGFVYNFRYMYNTSPRLLESATGIYSVGLTYTF